MHHLFRSHCFNFLKFWLRSEQFKWVNRKNAPKWRQKKVAEAKIPFFSPTNFTETVQLSTIGFHFFSKSHKSTFNTMGSLFWLLKIKKNGIKRITHKSGLASILLKKSPLTGFKELINLFTTISVSTLKYCV